MCVRWRKMMVEWYGIDIHVKQVEVICDSETQDGNTNWPDNFQMVLSIVSNLEICWLEIWEMRWNYSLLFKTVWYGGKKCQWSKMKYIIFKWSDLKYSSGCSDVIWKARISWGEMEYNITRWIDLEDFPNIIQQ